MLLLAFVAVEVFAYIICLRKLFVFALQALLSLRRCPFFLSDFFGSHAPRIFPSSLSLPSEGRDGGGRSRDALVLLPKGFPLLPLDLVQREGWRSLWSRVQCTRARLLSPRFIRGLGIQELLSCGGLLLPFLSRLVLPPHLCMLGEVLGRENPWVFFLCSRLPLPPNLCTLGEVVGRLGLPSAAPVRVLPGLSIFSLGSREGTLSPLLVEWLSCVILLLTLSLSLPCSVQRSGRCGRGSSRLLFYLVRARCDRWRSTDR